MKAKKHPPKIISKEKNISIREDLRERAVVLSLPPLHPAGFIGFKITLSPFALLSGGYSDFNDATWLS